MGRYQSWILSKKPGVYGEWFPPEKGNILMIETKCVPHVECVILRDVNFGELKAGDLVYVQRYEGSMIPSELPDGKPTPGSMELIREDEFRVVSFKKVEAKVGLFGTSYLTYDWVHLVPEPAQWY